MSVSKSRLIAPGKPGDLAAPCREPRLYDDLTQLLHSRQDSLVFSQRRW